MSIENNLVENPIFEAENYTYVSAQTLENAFPEKPATKIVEHAISSAPQRPSKERATLKKNLFFSQK